MTRLYNLPDSLTSTLELDSNRKKQLTEESSSMRSKAGPVPGPAVTKSINPELAWKTVRKGRRTRKAVARNVSAVGKAITPSPKRVGDLSISDSDKVDESVTTIGHRHFLENRVEGIPIKKRRHLFRPHDNTESALSPQPKIPSPHTCHLHSDSYKKQRVKGSAEAKFTDDDDDMDRDLYNPDDLSGINLLAAAACIDSMDDVNKKVDKDLHTQKQVTLPEKFEEIQVIVPQKFEEKEVTMVPENFEEKEVTMLPENFEEKEVTLPERFKENEDTLPEKFEDNDVKLPEKFEEKEVVLAEKSEAYVTPILVKCNSCPEVENPSSIQKEVITGKCISPSKIDRLYWDLNVGMDAWEQPFDDSVEKEDVKKEEVKKEEVKKEEVKKSEDSQFYTQEYMSLFQTMEDKSKLISSSPDRDTSITKLDEIRVYVDEVEDPDKLNKVVSEDKVGGKVSNICKTQEPENSGSNFYDGSSSNSGLCSPKGVCESVSIAGDDAIVTTEEKNISKSNSVMGKDGAQSGDHNSDVSQEDDGRNMEIGYDSPYEDGELRVSTSYPCDEYVDYDSDCADFPGSEVVEAAGSEGSLGTENKSLVEGSVSDFNRGRMSYNNEIEKMGNPGVEGPACGSRTTVELKELNENNNLSRVDMKGSHNNRVVEEHDSRPSRREILHSLIEGGPSSNKFSSRKETTYLPQSRSRVYTRPGRDISPNKYMGRQRYVRGGGRGDEQDGYWDSRDRFACTTNNNYQSYTRSSSRSMISDSDDRGVNYMSKGINRDRDDDYYSVERRKPGRELSRRGRGSIGNYVKRGGRDHHNQRYRGRDRRSFSPSSGAPFRISRSRSRTPPLPPPPPPPHPHGWHSRREWNHEMRRSSRSPDYIMSEGRAERVRMPPLHHNKPNFDYSGSSSIVSPPIRQQRRWVDDHDYNNSRRSPPPPVKTLRRGSQRSDTNYYYNSRRQGQGQERFPHIENYDERRRDDKDRVEIMRHRARRSDNNGGGHEVENNFEEDVRSASAAAPPPPPPPPPPRSTTTTTSREDKRSSFNV